MSDRSLPAYARPPVNEVVLGVQSNKLTLTTPLLGLFWASVRESYPDFQVQPALDPVVERFGETPQTVGPVPGLRLLEQPETPRCWFLEKPGNRLIQVQQDRLIYNWRRVVDSDQYPHYAQVKDAFAREYERLSQFVKTEERAGQLEPNWCETTYINHLLPDPGRWAPGELEKLFTVFGPRPDGGFLPPAEQGQFAFTFLIPDSAGEPLGRLHVSLARAIRQKDSAHLLVFELTARGRPDGEGLDGVLRFMDRAHEWIVRGFTELTRPSMHELWGRFDG